MSEASDRVSSRKCSILPGNAAIPGDKTRTATVRPIVVWTARYTLPQRLTPICIPIM